MKLDSRRSLGAVELYALRRINCHYLHLIIMAMTTTSSPLMARYHKTCSRPSTTTVKSTWSFRSRQTGNRRPQPQDHGHDARKALGGIGPKRTRQLAELWLSSPMWHNLPESWLLAMVAHQAFQAAPIAQRERGGLTRKGFQKQSASNRSVCIQRRPIKVNSPSMRHRQGDKAVRLPT